MNLNVYTDGGSRGNPGISGYGMAIYDQSGQLVYQAAKFLGIKTNNEAEYLGLIAALNWVRDNQDKLNPTLVNFYSDSQLLIRQVQGLYKVKSSNLIHLHQTVRDLINQVDAKCHFNNIRRESNKIADNLANQAMDQRL